MVYIVYTKRWMAGILSEVIQVALEQEHMIITLSKQMQMAIHCGQKRMAGAVEITSGPLFH